MKNKPKVVRVNRIGFELEDGRIYGHPVPLDYDPTIEDFQRIYDHWKGVIEKYVEEADQQTDRIE